MDYNKLLRQTVNNLGGSEDVIKDMQTRINKQSYTPIKEDGIWGEETQRAVNMLDDVTLQSIRDFFYLNDKYLDKRNSFEHVGKKVRLKNNGIVIDITPADLLIAAHRRGAKNVYNYFSSLAKGVDGVYYLPEEVDNDAFREIENRWKLLKN